MNNQISVSRRDFLGAALLALAPDRLLWSQIYHHVVSDWNGRHLVIGFASGEIAKLPANLPLLKGGALVGVDIRQFGLYEPQVSANNIQRLFSLYAAGALKPIIGATFPLDQYVLAMKAVSEVAGRVVLDVGGEA